MLTIIWKLQDHWARSKTVSYSMDLIWKQPTIAIYGHNGRFIFHLPVTNQHNGMFDCHDVHSFMGIGASGIKTLVLL